MDWVKDIAVCTVCGMFSTPPIEAKLDKCARCGRISTLQKVAFETSLPVSIPSSLRLPARPESPHLTPNLLPVPSLVHFMSPVRVRNSVGHEDSTTPSEEESEDDYTDPTFLFALEESLETAPSPDITPADPKILAAMTKFKYIPLGTTPTACAICLDDFTPGDDLVRTPCCKGVTHHACMDNTLCVISSCPFCRSTLSSSAPSSSQIQDFAKII